jgi:hypothetical protein
MTKFNKVRAALRRRGRASIGGMFAVALPAVVLVGGLSSDLALVTYRHAMLQMTAKAGALAGQTYLSSYYQNGGTYSTSAMSTLNSVVQTVWSAAMPAATYGTIVPTTSSNSTSNIQLGTWSTSSGSFTATTTNPNAVMVTALATAANGNAVKLNFGGIIGMSTVDMSATAIASFGNGLSSAGGFNTIILNDLSMSFSSEISNQRTADIAMLNCISNGTNGNGSVGLSTFNGDPWMHNAAGVLLGFPIQVAYTGLTPYTTTAYTGTLVKATSANVAKMTTYINNTLNYCGTTGMPSCSGSNLAAGLYSAVQQLSAQGLANASSNIIVITDGVPNAESRTYSTSDGTGRTPSSTINTTYSWSGCTTSCSDTNLWNAAQAWAAYAGSLGINISTVYYSGDTGSSQVSSYSTKLASLVQNQGIALVAPSASSINTSFATFCSTMGAAIKKTS